MASETDGGRDYSLVEIFVLKFVLADVIIIAALLLASPIWAVLIAALFVLSSVLLWYLMESADEDSSATAQAAAETGSEPAVDPVTKLQDRYAAGEISEDEFETKLDQLIESNERAEQAGVDTDDLELELERSD